MDEQGTEILWDCPVLLLYAVLLLYILYVHRWMNKRLKYGFSEFNSDTYGPIALKGRLHFLLNLFLHSIMHCYDYYTVNPSSAVMSVAGCAPDPEVQQIARSQYLHNYNLYSAIYLTLNFICISNFRKKPCRQYNILCIGSVK